MNLRLSAILIALSLPVVLSAQTVDFVLVGKTRAYAQNGPSSHVAHPTEPWQFEVSVEGQNISGITAPTFTTPAGSGISGGTLVWIAQDGEWQNGVSTPVFSSQAAMDASYGSGTYTVTAQGTPVSLSLMGNNYPNVPQATASAGTWDGGVLRIDANQALTLTSNVFSAYNQNAGAHIGLWVDGFDYNGGDEALSFEAPAKNYVSHTIPANTLTPGQTYNVEMDYFSIIDFKQTLGDINVAGYATRTEFQIIVNGSSPTFEFITVGKQVEYVQTGPATISTVEPNAFSFEVNVEGANLAGIAAPTFTSPAGSGTFGGTLTYDSWDDGDGWGFLSPAFASQAALDAAFASGTYTLMVQGTPVTLPLTGNAYPNAPQATVSAGTWSGSQLMIDANQALTITTNVFTSFYQNAEAHMGMWVWGQNYDSGQEVFRTQNPSQDFLSLTIPANTLTPGQTYEVEMSFDPVVHWNNALGGLGAAYFSKRTTFQIVVNSPGRLVNLSIRTTAGAGSETLIAGFVAEGGTQNASLLVRAAGPALSDYGVTGVLADPSLAINTSSQIVVASNNDWPAGLASLFAEVGAFSWTVGSKDAAIGLNLPPAPYTAVVTGSGTTGVALAEIYEVSTGGYSPTRPRLVNVSARSQVGTDANIMIAGFVIGGNTPQQLLIRAVGPTLGTYGVIGVLADPQLAIFSGATQINSNNDWSAPLATTFAQVGAFPLNGGSKDAALLVTLAPGVYTAQVSGVGGTTGVALVEVYVVP